MVMLLQPKKASTRASFPLGRRMEGFSNPRRVRRGPRFPWKKVQNRQRLRRLRPADIEDAKTLECGKLQATLQEHGKLQATLQEMQQKFDETKSWLVKECGVAKTNVEGAPTIRDVSVIDNELMDKLRDKNEKLMALVQSLEKKVDETEKKFEETSLISDERLKKAMEVE